MTRVIIELDICIDECQKKDDIKTQIDLMGNYLGDAEFYEYFGVQDVHIYEDKQTIHKQ